MAAKKRKAKQILYIFISSRSVVFDKTILKLLTFNRFRDTKANRYEDKQANNMKYIYYISVYFVFT